VSTIHVFARAHHQFFQFILLPGVFFPFLLLVRFLLFTPLELIWPARKLSYMRIIGRDLVAFLILRYAMIPGGAYLNSILPGAHHIPIPAVIADLPLSARLLIYFVLGDLGHYWIHRLTHTRYFWRVHKWHHSPTYMYWLAGMRSTALDIAMVSLPYILIVRLLDVSPWWTGTAISVAYVLITDWMHLNIPWRLKWLEWIIVTPRYHHIHHSANPQHFVKNLAPIFSVWDRLFGTYLDPDQVETNLSFGAGENTNPVRLLAGI